MDICIICGVEDEILDENDMCYLCSEMIEMDNLILNLDHSEDYMFIDDLSEFIGD